MQTINRLCPLCGGVMLIIEEVVVREKIYVCQLKCNKCGHIAKPSWEDYPIEGCIRNKDGKI